MKNTEFKTKQFKDATVYTLESATGGGTSAGAVASVSSPTGGVRRRGDNLIAQEANTDKIDASKPRNFVAKNAKTGGAGAHKDKKKAEKQGDVKHKNKDMDMAEGLPQTLRKVVPGYAKREIDKKMDAGKFGKTDADKDANFQRYKKIQDKLKEFAPDGFNGGDDGDGFDPEIAKMAQEHGFTKGVSLADGATLEMAMKINHWHSQHGGMYKQYFAKGFKTGRMNKVNHDNKQYNLNLKLMKDGSIRHGEQGVEEGVEKTIWVKPSSNHTLIVVKSSSPDIEAGEEYDEGDLNNYANNFGYKIKEQGVAEGLSKRDQQDVAAIRAAIARLEAQLNHPNADRDAIQQSIAHEKKRLALYGQGVAEDSDPCWKDYKQLGMKKKGGKQVPNCVPKEGMAEDHEIQMASSELQSIAKNAESLLDMVRKYSEQDGLQAWQQSKITKAADYLNSVLQSVNGEQSDLNEGASDYVGDAIEDLRMSKPGLDRESFLDELYFYIDAQYGKQAADAAMAHENDAEFDDWYASYSDMAEDHSDMGQGFGKNGYRTAQAQKIQPNAGNVPVAEDEYMAELFNKLAEKIPANAPVDVWIKDFEKSNAPQFRGKNLAKRREMAVAASYGAKNPSKKKKK